MSNVSFGAAVAGWVHDVQGLAEDIFKESVEELVNTASETIPQGGNLPIDTGALRASVLLSTTAMPMVRESEDGASTTLNPSQIETVLEGVVLGDTVFVGWTAAYAYRIEFGFTGVDSLGRYYESRPYGYVRRAAQDWQEIVNRSARRASAKIGFSSEG